MDLTNVYTVQKFISIVIIIGNILSVTSKIITLQNEDPSIEWSGGMIANFNNEYAVLIDSKYSDELSNLITKNQGVPKNLASELRRTSECPGYIHSCWLKTEENSLFQDYDNRYFCLCNHTYNSDILIGNPSSCNKRRDEFYYPPCALLDSFCFDPINIEDNYVITGVRFRRYENRIHLEVQKAKLYSGRIYSNTVKWHTKKSCLNSKKIFTRNSNSVYDGLKIVLNDLILPEDAVVTGVKFRDSVVGRYLNENRNIDRTKNRITHKVNCHGTNNILEGFNEILPSTALVGNNQQLSHPCRDYFFFNTTSFDFDYQQHIVPFIDLREVVTNPPEAIRGIGWYHRGISPKVMDRQPGGYLSLRIFTNRYY